MPASTAQLRRLIALGLSLALLLLSAGCATTATPGPTSTPGPTTTPTAGPTETPLIDHPTDPTTVILRLEEGGGFVPISFLVTQAPSFSLFGDGTVIYRPVEPPDAGVALGPPPFLRARMDEAQVAALLAFALNEGGLGLARAHYENANVADAPSTIFTIRANGLDKTVDVYALGMEVPGGQDAGARAAFLGLAERLRDFAAEVKAGRATDQGVYDPPAYRAVLTEQNGVPGEVRDWPWSDLAPEDFTPRGQFSQRTAILTPAQAKALSDTPAGGLYSVSVLGPDRAPYVIALRPLLPDEEE